MSVRHDENQDYSESWSLLWNHVVVSAVLMAVRQIESCLTENGIENTHSLHSECGIAYLNAYGG